MQAGRKQVVFRSETGVTDPVSDGISRWFRDLKLNGPLRLLLHDGGACADPLAVRDVAHPQFDQIAGPELAVDRQIEQCEIANPRSKVPRQRPLIAPARPWKRRMFHVASRFDRGAAFVQDRLRTAI